MEKTRSRSWDSSAHLILLIAVMVSAWRLNVAGWADDLGRVTNVAVVGFGVGAALGYSRFQKRGSAILALGYMFVVIGWQLLGAIALDDQALFLDKLSVLIGRLATDFGELLAGKPVEDQFFVVALMCLPYWSASLYGGYHLARHANFLKAILPNGLLMLAVHIYHYTVRDYTWMFGAYLFLALALLSRLKYAADRKKWEAERVQFSSESGPELANTTLIAAAALILLAWGTPYVLPASPRGVEVWRNIYREFFPPDRFDNIFASVEKESPPRASNFRTDLALGTRTPQSEAVVFRVYAPAQAQDIARLYWRGQIFDFYANGTWRTTGGNEVKREPADGDLIIPDSAQSEWMGFTFDISQEGQTILYIPSQPVWTNHDAIVLYSELPVQREQENEAFYDVMALRAVPALKSGELYRAGALIGNPSIPELREAGQDYPNWVKRKYLQLPENFSPRIRDLASQIAAPYDTPYEKARAITDYLRNEIEYSAAVLSPQEDEDPLEYFLFVSKTGFCNYYASAEVLMLRSIGIPARLAVGYAQGEPNLQNSVYVVRERDLHAWPEVYFPEYGWVEFEPTGNQDALERPLEREESAINPGPLVNPINQNPFEVEEEPPPPVPGEETAPAQAWLNGLASALPWLGGVFFLFLGLALRNRFSPDLTAASVLRRAIERSGWTPPRWLSRWLVFVNRPPIEQHFHSINVSLRWMKRPQAAHVTAYERAQILKRLLPGAVDSIETLLREHHSEMFTPRAGNAAITRRAAWIILYKTAHRRLKIAILGYNYAEEQETPPHPL